MAGEDTDKVHLAVVSGWHCSQSEPFTVTLLLATRCRLAVVLSWGVDSGSAALRPHGVCVLVIMFE